MSTESQSKQRNSLDRLKSNYHRQADHVWRYRWAWVLVPSLVIGCVLWFVPNSGEPVTASEEFTFRLKASAVIGFAMATLFAWAIALFYAFVKRKFKWMIAVLILPPLAFVFMMKNWRHGE